MNQGLLVSLLATLCMGLSLNSAIAEQIIRPIEIDDVLINPGMGLMSFQRFNGDQLNSGLVWNESLISSERLPKEEGAEERYPRGSLAYIRIYWRFLEPKQGEYQWELIDQALERAKEENQTLMLRVMAYGHHEEEPEMDVPSWYREITKEPLDYQHPDEIRLRVNQSDPKYLKHFGGLIQKLGERYDGHPQLESVDISFSGPWGEGVGSALMSRAERKKFFDLYFDSFPNTMLLVQPWDWKRDVGVEFNRPNVGMRFDCLGDYGIFSKNWNHMQDLYPQVIIESGLRDAWKKRPVSLETCGVIRHWKDQNFDLDSIIEQSLKWHISSLNAKSSSIPEEWMPQVEDWLKKMGYRFVLKKITLPESLNVGERFEYKALWENKGVAPPYKNTPVAIRIQNSELSFTWVSPTDVREWLPGDQIDVQSFELPEDFLTGDYDVFLALVDSRTLEPKIRLAIEGRIEDGANEGWYSLGSFRVEESEEEFSTAEF